ncbi:hypothetical protein F5J12DRAFT_785810 [Pisolithus orientalis]|uniref:uncharacterized protein n=1 Tax=Pisolithus orientalis TaxID=936130 RepID=UPI0022251046|nr:uncharacterized protein F5J12DRAFT_785810 [Pisolithus orientalis]KAI5994246.1 hypothetical protein F5J12DRAFT_785810 [Pisolithus orientalis]
MQGLCQGTRDWCAVTEWGCAEGTGEVTDSGWEESSSLGYKVWARTTERSTRWVVGDLPPELLVLGSFFKAGKSFKNWRYKAGRAGQTGTGTVRSVRVKSKGMKARTRAHEEARRPVKTGRPKTTSKTRVGRTGGDG